MKIAGQYTPFWGGQHARFLHIDYKYPKKSKIDIIERVSVIGGSFTTIIENITNFLTSI